ncbi:MAG: hypothetical protein ACUVQ8_02165 [Nitrososphaeria archaeon]
MKRKGQSASIAIVFIALMFISAYTTLYAQIENFREETRLSQNRISEQSDKVRERIECRLDKSTLILYNNSPKHSQVKYIILFDSDKTVSKIIETNIEIQPDQEAQFHLQDEASEVSVVTTLGNIFPAQKDPIGNTNNSFGGANNLDEITPVRLYVNPDNTTSYFVVEGLNIIHHFSSNGTKLGTYYTGTYRYISDTPYRAWVYELAPVYPASSFLGSIGYKIASYDKGYSSGGFHGDNLLFHDWILSPAAKDNQYNSTAFSLESSIPLNFVAQCTSGNRIIGVSASDYGGKTAYVMHAVYNSQTSSFKVYKTNVTISSYTGTRYYVWSYFYPYFVVRVAGSNPDIVITYKFVNDSRAIKIFTSRYGGSTKYTSYLVGNGYFYSYNYTGSGIVIGARNLQTLQWITRTLPYKPFAFKCTNYGLVFLKLNGLEVYEPSLSSSKNMNLSKDSSWYFPETTYSSEFIVDAGDWGYEFFQYQLAFLDPTTILAIVMNENGKAEVVKIKM